MSAFDPASVRHRFPALARTQDGQPVVVADAPGGSQVPDTVIEAVSDVYRRGISNSGGAFATSREADTIVANARFAAADLLGTDAERVVFGPNSTSLLFQVSRSFAKTLSPGDRVVLSRLDHDANIRPWALAARDAGADIRWVDIRADDATMDLDSFDEALATGPALVAFTLASNAVGSITPAAELIGRAKDAGALVAVDGVHLAQHRAIDAGALGADVLTVSPYKIFGPHLGILVGSLAALEGWEPYRVRPAEHYPSPLRWETGTPNHEGLAGFIAAVDYLAEVGRTHGAPVDRSRASAVRAAFDVFGEHERGLATAFLTGLDGIEAARLYGIADPARCHERTPTFALRVGDQLPVDTATALGERGIYVWDGHYYAMELFERLGILDSGGAVRIGFCHYHTRGEVDRVLQALDELATPR